MKSKQTSDSGIFQNETLDQTNQPSFGFSNITAKQEVRPAESFARKGSDNIQVANIPQQQQSMGYNNQAYQQQTLIQQQYTVQNQQQFANQQFQQPANKLVPPQQLQERYVSPQIGKTESPTKNNPQVYQQQYTQQQPTQSFSQSPVDPLSNSRPQQQFSNPSQPNLQQSRT